MRFVVGICSLAVAACSIRAGTYVCATSDECTGTTGGVCEPDGFCSFPDPSCPEGRRYGELSGPVSGKCVGDPSTIDAPGGDGPASSHYVGALGSATCGSGSTTITLTSAVPAGDTVVVRIGIRTSSLTATSVSDSRGNTYTLDASAANTSGAAARIDVFSSRLTTALAAADTITATYPAGDSNAIAVEHFTALTGTLDKITATGNTANPTASLTVSQPAVLLGAMQIPNFPTFTEPADFTSLGVLHPQCGGAPGNSGSTAGIRAVGAGTFAYTVTTGGTTWAVVVVGYGVQ